MSDQPLQRAGIVIDGLEFARDGRRKAGRIPLAALERLADSLLDTDGDLQFELQGEKQGRNGSFLNLRVSAQLSLRCQRCLEPMRYPLELKSRLRLMPPGADWPEDELEDDSADAVEAREEMALLPLIEEEVLLALPIAPVHPDCDLPAGAGKDQESSPFAVLAKLKNRI